MDDQNLTEQNCQEIPEGTPPLNSDVLNSLINKVDRWEMVNERRLSKHFEFDDFVQALEFVNRVGELAEEQSHHPDIFLHNWNKVHIQLSTHSVGGLSQNDFILAAKIDKLTAE